MENSQDLAILLSALTDRVEEQIEEEHYNVACPPNTSPLPTALKGGMGRWSGSTDFLRFHFYFALVGSGKKNGASDCMVGMYVAFTVVECIPCFSEAGF